MMNGKIIIGGIVVLLCLIGGILLWQKISEPTQLPAQPTQELKLSDFPEAFKEKTVIVLGDNASEIERQAAEEIKNFLLEHNSSYIKVIDSQKIESFKKGYNLVIIGTPETNPLLEEVYAMTNATRVTEEFPGEGKGVLEILPNPWDESKAMLLVEGSDAVGVNIMGQIASQIKKIHLNRIYGPYKGYEPPELPPGIEGLPDPSAVYCTKLGYKYEIRTLSDGSQIGYCVFDSFPGRKECPAWDFFNGLCGEEYTYCSKTGGVLVKIKNAGYVAACILPSGKICYEWDYSQGGCK